MKSPRADKNFGQHFLVNAGVVSKICEWVKSGSKPNSEILEIGPGPGALTAELLKHFSKVRVVEIDRRMVTHLEQSFSAEVQTGRLVIYNQDALEISQLKDLEIPSGVPVTLVGNLPYNVGTKIVFQFLENFPEVDFFCIMLQKEVIDRLKARVDDDDFGIPSLKCELLGEAFESFFVSPGSFRPPPKVDSAVLRFRRRKDFNELESRLFQDRAKYLELFKLINQAFTRRRKMLKSQFPALKDSEWGSKRPENLSLQDWLSLYFDGKLK